MHAPAYMRLWLLLCSDLAIRSGTAARIAPRHYDPLKRELRFTTKHQERVTLPVTEAVAVMLADCDMNDSTPFVFQLRRRHATARHPDPKTREPANQLRAQFQRLRIKVGINRRITPHDLRRTTACAIYDQTRDLRIAQSVLGHKRLQSTLHYLDHHTHRVDVATLEAAKRPYLVARKEQSA